MGAASAFGWTVFLACLVLVRLMNAKVKGSFSGKVGDAVAVIMIALSFAAGCGMAFTFLGSLFAGTVNLFAKIPAIGPAIPVVLLITLIVTVAVDVGKDREADTPAQFSALLLPVAMLLIAGGIVGQAGDQAVPAVTQYVANTLTQLVG